LRQGPIHFTLEQAKDVVDAGFTSRRQAIEARAPEQNGVGDWAISGHRPTSYGVMKLCQQETSSLTQLVIDDTPNQSILRHPPRSARGMAHR
jgi:hypothetical protein